MIDSEKVYKKKWLSTFFFFLPISAKDGIMSEADLGGGWRSRGGKGDVKASPSRGFDPLLTQRSPPLYYFEISIFG